MNLVPVCKLCEQAESARSTQWNHRAVVGRFEQGAQGAIILRDVHTRDAIHCRTDIFHHELFDLVVCIAEWTLIQLNSEQRWLEFQLQHVFRVGVDGSCVLQQLLFQERVCAELFASRQQQQPSPAAEQHRLGRVVSKPVLCGDRFFLKVDGTVIGFRGASLTGHYHNYRVGSYYLFVNLAPVDTARPWNMVEFVAKQSHAYMLTDEHYHQLTAATNAPHDPVPPPAVYSGTVTRIIDPDFGVYELDSQIILCLFHWTNYNLLYPYRAGTRLRITDAHVVHLTSSETGDAAAAALKRRWKVPEPPMFLVGCLQSHVQTTAFPEHVDAAQPEHTATEYLFRGCVRRRPDFPTLLLQLDVHAAVMQKFAQSCPDGGALLGVMALELARWCVAIRDASATTTATTRACFGSDMLGDLFEHHKQCSAMGAPGDMVFYAFPALKDLVDCMLGDDSQREDKPVGYLSATSAQDMMSVYTSQALFPASDDDLSTHVVGFVECGDDGRLYLADDTHRIPLVIPSAVSTPPPLLGDLYVLRKFRLLQEDLSYTGDSHTQVALGSTYIVCNLEDMEHIAAVGSRRLRSIRLTPPLPPAKTIGAFAMDGLLSPPPSLLAEEGHLCLFSVLGIHPVHVHADDHGQFSLNAYLRTIAYPVCIGSTTSEQPPSGPPFEATVVLQSQAATLRYLPYLHVGGWFGLLGDVKTRKIKAKIPTRKSAKSRPPVLLSVIEPDGSNEMLLVSSTPSANEIMSLVAHQASTPVAASAVNERIYGVGDLHRADPDRGPSMKEVTDRYLAETVHVQGIVTIKTFRNTARPRGPIYRSAEALYRQWGVGTGQSGRTAMIRLRQLDGLDTIDIYMDMGSRPYPLGVVPGSHVVFYSLVRRRRGDGSYYAQAIPATRVHVVRMQFDPASYLTFASELIPSRSLAQASALNRQHIGTGKKTPATTSILHTVFRCDCTLQKIYRLSLRWMCTGCGMQVSNNACYGACKRAHRTFCADAQIEVTDGTATARVFCEGEVQVLEKLLKLPPTIVGTLKDKAVDQPLAYEAWLDDDLPQDDDDTTTTTTTTTTRTLTLRDLCERRITDPYTLYGRILTDKRTKQRLSNEQGATLRQHGLAAMRVNADTGDPFGTAVPPRLRIVAMELDPQDPAELAWRLVNNIEKSAATSHAQE